MTSSRVPAVVLMVGAPGAASAAGAAMSPGPELRATLGPERSRALWELLTVRAATWAEAAAPSNWHIACAPAGTASLLRSAVGRDVRMFEQEGETESERLRHAVEQVSADGERPVLAAWPELPHWPPDLATAALGDLAAGCDAALGPVFDGGLYLLALDRPIPELFALPDEAWRGPDAFGLVLAAAYEAGLSAGLLSPERGLRTEADARAALADPLLDPELAAVLRGG